MSPNYWGRLFRAAIALSLLATSSGHAEVIADSDALERARQLLKSTPLVDGHNDLPWLIYEETAGDVAAFALQNENSFDTDIPRLRQGLVGAQFWSVWIPGETPAADARSRQMEQIQTARQIIDRHPETFELATTADDIERIYADGKIASLLGMEGGYGLNNSLAAIQEYYDLGVRYMTLTHNVSLDWADAALGEQRNGGLTEFGREVVREMNRSGMIVDIAHTSPQTMHQVLDVTKAPVIFSHAAAAALVDHPRNVADDVLVRLPKNGGVVMVTFIPSFLSNEVWDMEKTLWATDAAISTVREYRELWNAYDAEFGAERATIEDVADHIEHIRDVAGMQHVGIGSDYWGMPDMPVGLEDVTGFPRLFAELIQRGWSDEELTMLAGGNILRVMRDTQRIATGLKQTTNELAADSVYMNGEFYAGKIKNPWLAAVAIKDGKFVYVGDDPASFIGPTTDVYDLGGRLVLPGLTDAHTHPGVVALTLGQFELDVYETREELLEGIERVVRENPDEEVLIGGFWSNELFGTEGPRKEDLDKIESKRPLIIYDDWAHTVWANSVALEQAGVTRDTKAIVPGFSFYQKDEHGEPTGWITESAASVFINNFLTVSPDVEKTMLEFLEYLQGAGVTSVFDAGNFGLDREVYAAIAKLDQSGQLPVRYHGAYTLFVPNDYATAVESLKQLGADFNSDNVRIDTLKIFYDGVLETRTAALSEDYFDTPGNNGEILFGREQMLQLILRLEEEGLNLHVHSVGDRGTTTVLDAVEDAHAALSRPHSIRIAICHLEIVKETDFARFSELGVIGQFTPHWTTGGNSPWYEAGIGNAAFEMQRSQPLISDGAIVTFSSDITGIPEWHSGRADPFLGMQVGHNRRDVGVAPDGDFLPPMSERLQRDDLVNGYTTNAAYQLGRGEDFGTIAVGLAADLVVLNQNLFEVDRDDIHKTKPIAVVMDGEIVSGNLEQEE